MQRPDVNLDLHAGARLLWALSLVLLVLESDWFVSAAPSHRIPATLTVAMCASLSTAVLLGVHWIRPGLLLGGHVAIYLHRRPWVLPVIRQPLMPIRRCATLLVGLAGCAYASRLTRSRMPTLVPALLLVLHGLVTVLPCYGMGVFWKLSYSFWLDLSSPEDWFLDPETTTSLLCDAAASSLRSAVPHQAELLILGCGSSRLPAFLAESTVFRRIVATDISLSPCSSAFSKPSSVDWQHADAQQLPFADNSFDLLCEKAVYASMAGSGAQHVSRCFDEAFRVLRPGGVLVSVWMAHSQPLRYLQQAGCGFEVVSVTRVNISSREPWGEEAQALVDEECTSQALVVRKPLG